MTTALRRMYTLAPTNGDMTATPARFRFGGSKVRSGCNTCKARHVKCDEGRPTCERCLKACRDCSYTPLRDLQRQQKSRPLTIIHYNANPDSIQRLSCYPEHDPAERRAIDYFQRHTATELGGHFSSELWSRTLLQVAYHESTVRHAVVAVGSLHEQFRISNDAKRLQSEEAMQYYCKAIKNVVQLDLTQSQAVDTALLSCVLFAAFESLQGHFKSALTHISSGVKLLCEHEKPGGKFRYGYLSGQVLHPTFVRFDTQAMEISDVSFRPYNTRVPNEELRVIPQTFSSIDDAYLYFDTFINHILHFESTYRITPETRPEKLQEMSTEFTNLSEYFGQWSQAFDASCFPPSHPGVLILLIGQATIDALRRTEINMGETGWDKCLPWHTRIVELAEAFMAASSLPDPCSKQTSPSSSTTYPSFPKTPRPPAH